MHVVGLRMPVEVETRRRVVDDIMMQYHRLRLVAPLHSFMKLNSRIKVERTHLIWINVYNHALTED